MLLYIANLTGSAGACIGQTWYLMCDMQLFFCAPLLILPMYYLDKGTSIDDDRTEGGGGG